MTLASLVFEGAVALLIFLSAIMLWRVDSKLRALRSGQDGIRSSIIALDEASERARASLAALQRAARESGETLENNVKRAQSLADELRLLVDAGDRQAEGLAARPRRKTIAEHFPEGGRKTAFSDLKDVR
ncbi:DUF6468 domain-containing protein [Hyphobacterium sp. HN65]|uniref:DUF6468 domain-containing protein n=1 Tax=Hyphobacterium lacteum TaxID=3116575 RepID=A0ABU7LS70_9PROT|nr:DUF6468 domain-containing protein [Hyphobacterium sp. HN65]MEE2526184.1 DUF6468 domain-containing protein [Hyphobacterium sp. HN65]